MTFVGKILVVVIMLFSVLFLGFSTVVFTTSKNWMVATQAEQKKADELKKKLNDAQAQAQAAKKTLDDAKGQFDQTSKQLQNQLTSLQDENARNLAQITTARGQLGVANQTAKSTLDEVEAKREQTNQLRVQKSAVEKQANEFKLHQAELNDKIRELERLLDTATRNNSDLRERVAKFSALLQKNGLSTDIGQIKGLESPPPVMGEVKRVDPTNRRIEVTIGSDDGLVVGHELYLFRTSPRPEYLGKVSIVSVDPDQAVAKVVGSTYLGKKIKEGDIVSSTIKPRGYAPASAGRSAAAARPRGVLVQSPKSDIYVALLGISLSAIVIATILMIVLFSRYGFSTKVSALPPAASGTMLA